MSTNISTTTKRRTRRQLVILAFLLVILVVLVWLFYVRYREDQFVSNLNLVGFSTSMIGMPSLDDEHEALANADRLGIDLFAAYKHNLNSGSRCDLAHLLITRESAEYLAFVEDNLAEVPWTEVRLWRMQYKDDLLSRDYRNSILAFLLASPTSEAKLFAGSWYEKRGRIRESEDAYYAAMNSDFFWDALDAADLLLDSDRYEAEAIEHHFWVMRDVESFIGRSAKSLATHFDAENRLLPLIEQASHDSTSEKRAELLRELDNLRDSQLRLSDGNSNTRETATE